MNNEAKSEQWVRVARMADVPPGLSKRVTIRGVDIAIFNADGEFYAIGDECTHAETSLSDGEFFEDIRGWVVECPLHGSQFDVTTGEAISLPATGNSGCYALRTDEEYIYVDPNPVTRRRE